MLLVLQFVLITQLCAGHARWLLHHHGGFQGWTCSPTEGRGGPLPCGQPLHGFDETEFPVAKAGSGSGRDKAITALPGPRGPAGILYHRPSVPGG